MKTPNSPKRRQALQALALLATATTLPTVRAETGGAWLHATHKVEDFSRWKLVFDSTTALKRGNYGWKRSLIYAIDGDPNNVLVMEEFDTLAHAKAFAGSAELKAAMAKAGVIGRPEVEFVNIVARAKA